MNGTTAYILAQKYVKDTASGLGAVKGAPCKIKSITEEDGISTVVFEWKNDAGVTQESELRINAAGNIIPNDGDPATDHLETLTIGGVTYDIPANVEPIVMTYAEYQALTEEERNDGQIRYISDYPFGEGGSGSSGGGSSELTNALATGITVGGITAGSSYPVGTSIETILNDLLNPTLYPTFTNPSASLSGTGDKLLKTGSTLAVTLTATLNRGSINPAYGTSGKRSGAAKTYALNGDPAQLTNTWSETVSESNRIFRATITYEAGEQPKDSKGNNYNAPLAAGSVQSGTVTYNFVMPIYANTTSAETMSELALVSKGTGNKQLEFPVTTTANPECFDLPGDWTMSKIEVLNTLSGKWETATSQFTKTTTTHNDAAGNAVNYNRYTCNYAGSLGARSVKVYWS